MRKLQIGIIPDGNRKWARKSGLSLPESYIHGAKIAEQLINHSLERGDVGRIVFYALAKSNLELRTQEEVDAILRGIKTGIDLFKKIEGVSVCSLGDNTCRKVKEFFNIKQNNDSTKLPVNLLINYSPQWDLETQPIRTNIIPPLDLIIRPREYRLSGFLPVQSSNAQLYFPNCYWAEFDSSQFDKIVSDFKAHH